LPNPPEINIGPPDGNIYPLFCNANVVVDLGALTPIGTLVFYEAPNPSQPGWIALDWVYIELSTDNITYGPAVFYWGDWPITGNNGSILPSHYVSDEMDNEPIIFSELYGNTGILIGVGGTYRFVRFSAPPGCNDEAQIDAIQVLP
jgi:hypothetical protein